MEKQGNKKLISQIKRKKKSNSSLAMWSCQRQLTEVQQQYQVGHRGVPDFTMDVLVRGHKQGTGVQLTTKISP